MSDDASRLDLVSEQFITDGTDSSAAVGASFMASIVDKTQSIVQQLDSGQSDSDMVVDQLIILKRSVPDVTIGDQLDKVIDLVRNSNGASLDSSHIVQEAFSASQHPISSQAIDAPPDDLFPSDSQSVSSVS